MINADATRLPFKDSSFKTVICSEVLEHIRDDKRLINAIYRILDNDLYVLLMKGVLSHQYYYASNKTFN